MGRGAGRRATVAAWCGAVLVLGGPSPALAGTPAEPAEGAERAEPGRVERLHRPGLRSFFAFVDRRVRARLRPAPTARTVARLGLRTEDGTDELVLARTTDVGGRTWLQVRLPVRPNGTTGWVPEEALGHLQPVSTWLRIDRRRMRATLVRGRRVVFRARVGVGKPASPTPRGEFYIRHKLTGYGRAGSFYGPVAFGFAAYSAADARFRKI